MQLTSMFYSIQNTVEFYKMYKIAWDREFTSFRKDKNAHRISRIRAITVKGYLIRFDVCYVVQCSSKYNWPTYGKANGKFTKLHAAYGEKRQQSNWIVDFNDQLLCNSKTNNIAWSYNYAGDIFKLQMAIAFTIFTYDGFNNKIDEERKINEAPVVVFPMAKLSLLSH